MQMEDDSKVKKKKKGTDSWYIQQHGWISHMGQKHPNAKDYILSNPIYVSSKNRQNKSMGARKKKVVALQVGRGWDWLERGMREISGAT